MSQEQSNQEQPVSEQPRQKGRAIGTIVAVAAVIVALAGAAAWYLFFRGGDDADERAAYDTIVRYQNENKLDSLAEALNDYFDLYNSDAYHYSQLKALHDRFFTERADWQAAEKLHSYEAVRNFLDVHPDGLYRQQAHHALDSLTFVAAKADDTREAFEHYLNQFPQGSYAAEARKLMENLDNVDLTVEEKTSVKQTLDTHFNALADNDRAAITATLAGHVNSYIGKADPELEDIYAYMRNMHSASRTIVFLVKNINLTKVNLNGRAVYSARFNLDEETYTRTSSQHSDIDIELGDDAGETEGPKPESVKHFNGMAVLNDSMCITSLVLRQ